MLGEGPDRERGRVSEGGGAIGEGQGYLYLLGEQRGQSQLGIFDLRDRGAG